MKYIKVKLAATLGLALLGAVNRGTGASPVVSSVFSSVTAAPDLGVDPTVAPGDDFFAYSNGDWLATAKVPEGRKRWGARDDINALTKERVATLIKEAAQGPAAPRPVGSFYLAWLDAANIEKRGLAPLDGTLKSIDRLRDKSALARWLGAEVPVDADPLNLGQYSSSHPIGLAVEYGVRGETRTFAYLLQGGLGLERDAYLDETAPMKERRQQYQRYIAHMLEQAGIERAAPRAAAIVALETALAQAHATEEASASERNADNHWVRAEFPRLAPGMDWPAFFEAAGLAKQDDIVAWQPGALRGIAALVGSEPLPVWKDYLRFHLLDRYAEVLPHRFADAALEFRGAEPWRDLPREQRAIDATSKYLPYVVGRLYVETYFPFDAKANVQSIVANVLDAFRRRVEAAPWMSPASRRVALDKLTALYFSVGYPDKWPDEAGLDLDARDAVGNLQRIAAANRARALAALGRPADRYEWTISPQSAGGTLNFLQNTYNFSAALLQSPKFDPAGSEAANYGAIGAIVGHEISHYVDTLGADYDARGALTRWWTPEDKAQYDLVSRPLAEQFSAYKPFDDTPVNGRLGLTENVADLAGLNAAFDAYRRVLGNRADNKDFLRQQDRQFFIGFARAWRVKFTDAGLRSQAGTDHAPEMYRVSTVRNLDAWYEAFDVRPGQRLYLAPEARVRVW